MSIFKRAYEGLFSPRRNSEIVNESTKVMDEDHNSFSDGNVSDQEAVDDSNHGDSNGMNGDHDHDMVSSSSRKRKQKSPRRCVMVGSGSDSEDSPAKLQIVIPSEDDERTAIPKRGSNKKGGGDEKRKRKSRNSPNKGRKKSKKEVNEEEEEEGGNQQENDDGEKDADEEKRSPRRSRRSCHSNHTMAAADEEESPTKSRFTKGKGKKKQQSSSKSSPMKSVSARKVKDENKEDVQIEREGKISTKSRRRRAVKRPEASNESGEEDEDESPTRKRVSKKNEPINGRPLVKLPSLLNRDNGRRSPDLSNEAKKARFSSVVTKGKPPIKCPYLFEEDEALISYLAKSDLLCQIKGKLLWQQAEEDKATKSHRTWQSMKERFRKHIIPHMFQYVSIPKEDRDRVVGYWRGRMHDSLKPHASKYRPGRSTMSKQDDDESTSTDRDKSQDDSTVVSSKGENERRKLPSRSKRQIKTEVPEDVASDEDESSGDEDREATDGENQGCGGDLYLKYVNKGEKASKLEVVPYAFTRDEDVQIMAEVFNHSKKKSIVIRGNKIWKEIETVFPSRTFHSLRERFLKRIIPQLPSYCCEDGMNMRVVKRLINLPGLLKTESEKEDLIAACEQAFNVAIQGSEP